MIPEERREDLESARERLLYDQETFLSGFNLKGITLARTFLWADKASEAILGVAENYPDGLSVIGVANATRFRGAGPGATAERVLRATPGSLLVVK